MTIDIITTIMVIGMIIMTIMTIIIKEAIKIMTMMLITGITGMINGTIGMTNGAKVSKTIKKQVITIGKIITIMNQFVMLSMANGAAPDSFIFIS
jgi:hypothetical protein